MLFFQHSSLRSLSLINLSKFCWSLKYCILLINNTVFPYQNLAILFFQEEYKSSLTNLPGVRKDEKELTEVLKNYRKKIIKNSENVLNDLRDSLKDYKEKEFERIHFHYSGIDIYRILYVINIRRFCILFYLLFLSSYWSKINEGKI